MKPEQMESILYFILEGRPLTRDEAALLYPIEVDDRLDHRQAAIRLLALLITPPENPNTAALGIELMGRIWNAPRHVLSFQFVDFVYPADVITALLREHCISRSISGYFLLPTGIDFLKHYAKEHGEDHADPVDPE